MMRKVRVCDADGRLVEMMAVEEAYGLIYVISVDSVERMKNGLTVPVGVPKKDIIYQIVE